jgi:hypothetical protein
MINACPQRPDSGQPDPKEAIGRAQSGPRYGSSVHGELLAQGEVLQGELVVAAAGEGQQTEQVEWEGDDHRAGLWRIRTDRSTTWRGTGQAFYEYYAESRFRGYVASLSVGYQF